jgi:hypothetical protein
LKPAKYAPRLENTTYQSNQIAQETPNSNAVQPASRYRLQRNADTWHKRFFDLTLSAHE